ncbi:MAG: hypothetical protein ACREXW_12415 [Gammaproteobacteria bacterium]
MEAAEAEHLMNGLDSMDAAIQDVQGAVSYVGTAGPETPIAHRFAVTGFCIGGP